MEPSRSKRQRIMRMIVSHRVSSWPDLPAVFESLNDDTQGLILQFVGNKSYATYAGINKHCKEIYIASGMKKETFVYGYGSLSRIIDKVVNNRLRSGWGVGKGVVLYNRSDVFDWAIQGKKNQLLKGICDVAGLEGRIDIFNEVLRNVEDWDDKACIFDIFGGSSRLAACHGKLDVLKWLKTHHVHFNRSTCASEAASYGHVHILQWLKDQRLSLYGDMYYDAIGGDHLHVIKWLREQGCTWGTQTFVNAVKKGNLDILRYLHDEGCPWDSFHDLDSHDLDSSKPEVTDWLRANGYESDFVDFESDLLALDRWP